MPRAKSAGLRLSIVSGRQQGKTLQQLAEAHQVSYSTVQALCARFATEGKKGLQPRYAACGKKRPQADNFIFRAVRAMKVWHPSWGAEKIRSELLLRRPDLVVPPSRTLQQWFQFAGLTKQRDKQPRAPRQWATEVHEVWQLDAKEDLQTTDGVRNTWLIIKDEYSGAVLDPPVFPL